MEGGDYKVIGLRLIMASGVGLPNPGLELSQDQFGLFRVFSEEPLYEIVRRTWAFAVAVAPECAVWQGFPIWMSVNSRAQHGRQARHPVLR
jgi:hypothetical protein